MKDKNEIKKVADERIEMNVWFESITDLLELNKSLDITDQPRMSKAVYALNRMLNQFFRENQDQAAEIKKKNKLIRKIEKNFIGRFIVRKARNELED